MLVSQEVDMFPQNEELLGMPVKRQGKEEGWFLAREGSMSQLYQEGSSKPATCGYTLAFHRHALSTT